MSTTDRIDALERALFAARQEAFLARTELDKRLADAETMIDMVRERVRALENGKGVPLA